jgi:antitoxin component YwqK of YwqJK toxin-antitoxin module
MSNNKSLKCINEYKSFKMNLFGNLIKIFVLSILVSCGGRSNEISWKKVNFQDNYRRAFNASDKSPISGVVIFKDSTGKISTELKYENGIIEFVRIWSDSSLFLEANYKNGKENGLWKRWYSEKKIQSEKYFKNGLKDSIWKSWYPNGKLMYEIQYSNGVENGFWKTYFENGQINLEANFINGKENGVCIEYFENGKIKTEYNFKNGIKNGACKTWFEDGQINFDVNLIDGKENGICKEYYKNGQLKKESIFKNGIIEGKFKTWFENGKIWSEIFYKDGSKNGEWQKFGEDGKLKIKEIWLNDKCLSYNFFDKTSNLTIDEEMERRQTAKILGGSTIGHDYFSLEYVDFNPDLSLKEGLYNDYNGHDGIVIFFLFSMIADK